MFEKLKHYQNKFLLSNNEIEKDKSSSSHLLELFRRCDSLVDKGMIIYTQAMDMEPCTQEYYLADYQWGQYPESDPEWGYMLNRHGFLVDLSVAYFLTKDEKYFRKWKALAFDFMVQNAMEIQYPSISWRPLDVGIRLMNWVKSLTYLSLDWFSNEEKAIIRKSVAQHIHYIQDHFIDKYWLSNWGVLAVSGMLSAIYFDREHFEEEYQWAKATLQKQASLQFSAKGMHWEQSPLYHHQVVMSYAYLYQVCCYLGSEDAAIWRKVIQRPIACSYFLANHQGELLAINDSDAVNFDWVYSYYHLLGFESECKDYVGAVIYTGRQFQQRRTLQFPVVFVDQTAGWCMIKDAQYYFAFFCGLHGSSHGHASMGNIHFSTATAKILTNLGRFTYEEVELRRKLKSETAYNTILIPQRQVVIAGSWSYHTIANPVQMGVEEFEEFYLVEGSWQIETKENDSPVLLQRKVIVMKNNPLIVVIDESNSQGMWQANYLFDADFELKLTRNVYSTGTVKPSVNVPCAPRYQQLTQAVQMSVETQRDFLITVISQEELTIEESELCQVNNHQSRQGILLKMSNESLSLLCAYADKDIISGNKLVTDPHNGEYYGKLNLQIENRGYRVR